MPATNTTTTARLSDVEEEIRALADDMKGLRSELREHRELSRERHQAILDRIDASSQGGPTPHATKPRAYMLGLAPGTAQQIAAILAALSMAVASVAGAYFGARSHPDPAPIQAPIQVPHPVEIP